MRKRIIGGLVASAVFIGMVFFVIFLLDWYTGVDLRDYANLSWYDDTIENPVQVGEDLLNQAGQQAQDINQQLQDQGKQLDERFGVAQSETGLWAGVSDDPDEPTGLSSDTNNGEPNQEGSQRVNDLQQAYESQQEYESLGYVPTVKKGQTQTYTYEELDAILPQLGLSKMDEDIIHVLSKHNPVTVEGDTIIVDTTSEHVTITYK